MAFEKIILKPGIDTFQTPTLNSAGWSDSQLIRWREGLPEILGGWTRLSNTPVVGIARGLHAFHDLNINTYLAIGTDQRLQLLYGSTIYDITPVVQTADLSAPFTTTMGSAEIIVDDVGSSQSIGDWIDIYVPIAIGGIVLFGFYQVTVVDSADRYRFNAASNALSTVLGGGDTPLFTTTASSATVTVTLPNHGYMAGQSFEVQVTTLVGGLALSGVYLIVTVPDANTFTITTTSAAASNDAQYENSDQARIQYLLPPGQASTIPAIGYGGGGYGSGVYGGSTAGPAYVSQRNWWLDNFGEQLVAVPTNGTLYQWTPPVATGNVAQVVSTAPLYNIAMFVAMPQAQVVLCGSETGGAQDPLLVRFSANGDFTNYVASATNQAGSYRLSKGSNIVGAIQSPQFGLIWTDTDVWSMQYVGPQLVYTFTIVGSGCGLIAAKAMAILGRSTYWLSQRGFYIYNDGGLQRLFCTVWENIFHDFNSIDQDSIFAAANTPFNEVSWFYSAKNVADEEGPAPNGTLINSYVKYNVIENLWDVGRLVRTAWIDQSEMGLPIGIDGNSLIQQHETSNSADGEPLESYVQSGYADLANGLLFIFLDQIIPDFHLHGDNPVLYITVYVKNTPNSDVKTYGPFMVTEDTEYISFRARGRQLAFKVESTNGQTFYRLGAVRYRGAPTGRV